MGQGRGFVVVIVVVVVVVVFSLRNSECHNSFVSYTVHSTQTTSKDNGYVIIVFIDRLPTIIYEYFDSFFSIILLLST